VSGPACTRHHASAAPSGECYAAAMAEPPHRSLPPSRFNAYIPPCIPTRAYKAPAGADWVHGIKHDGYKFTATATRSAVRPSRLRR
jgi:hypothetical protein